ncbi:hypothetical protein DD237_005874 [Peronospora effusa]|uniref:Uncharacterized protein n=1 Tax=Peronospora effusa TaxID=542832 RepID=A0A425CBH2_9STRA|nr:hypothetical protein DD237_005874 [Peronospora effusa]
MDVWLKQKYSGDDVFKRLELKEAGILVFDSPLWDTWISYMVKKANSDKSQAKNGNKAISKTKLAVQVLMAHYDGDVLRNWLSTAKSKIGNKRAGYIERSFNQILKEGEAPVTRKRQRNEGKAPAP